MSENNFISSAWDTYELASKRYNDGNKIGALVLLLNKDEDGKSSPESLFLTGSVYFDFEMFDYALEYFFRYLASVKKIEDKAKGYNAISACYCRLNEIGLMNKYNEEQIKAAGHRELEYDDVIFDFYEALDSIPECDDGFYPIDGAPSEKTVWEASLFLSQNMFEEAYEKLLTVGKGSDKYVDARINMALCLTSLDKRGEALEVLSRLAEDFPSDAAAQLSYAAFLLDENRVAEAKSYLLKAADIPTDNEEDSLRTAELLLRYFGEEEKAAPKLDECLRTAPYNIDALTLKGQILYNNGKAEEAFDIFKLCYDLTRSPAAEYYLDKATENIDENDGKPKKKKDRLEYETGLPHDIALNFFNIADTLIADFYEKDGLFAKKIGKYTMKATCDWVFSFPNEIQADFALYLLRSNKKYKKFLIEKLLSEKVTIDAKFSIVQGLLDCGYEKKVDAVMQGILMQAKLVCCDFGSGSGEKFTLAYNLAFSKVCFFGDYAEGLMQAARGLFYDIKLARRLGEADDVNALAGAMLYLMKYKDVKRDGYFERMLETSEKKVKKILALRDEKPDKSRTKK